MFKFFLEKKYKEWAGAQLAENLRRKCVETFAEF